MVYVHVFYSTYISVEELEIFPAEVGVRLFV